MKRIRALRDAAACIRYGSARIAPEMRIEIADACEELASRLEKNMKPKLFLVSMPDRLSVCYALMTRTPIECVIREEGQQPREQVMFVHAIDTFTPRPTLEVSFLEGVPACHELYQFFYSEDPKVDAQLTTVLEQEDEVGFLRWFYSEADFGPADGDVRDIMKKQYVEKTGKPLPEGYE
jgi:hypothetical protein